MYISDLVDDVWVAIRKIEDDGATIDEVNAALVEVAEIEQALEDDVFEDSLPHVTRFLAEEVARILKEDCDRLKMKRERPLTL